MMLMHHTMHLAKLRRMQDESHDKFTLKFHCIRHVCFRYSTKSSQACADVSMRSVMPLDSSLAPLRRTQLSFKLKKGSSWATRYGLGFRV